MAILLDGKKVAEHIEAQVRETLAALGRPAARLVGVCVGESPAACVYLKSQAKLAGELGITYHLEVLPQSATQEEVAGVLRGLNKDAATTGVILQAPLPQGLDARSLRAVIAPEKDAEGIHPSNLGAVVLGGGRVLPCTAAACMEILRAYDVPLRGREAVVVGHSEIVGKPLALMLLKEFATTTVCHIATSEAGRLEEHVRRADVLIVAVGKPGVVPGEWVKEGAAVLDVGINRLASGVVGDVVFESASRRAACITPVPGGVGPVTVAMLMKNTVGLLQKH
ncbi:MAG: bifunctional 5,10-methylenetetrahydrofolate dehydrogenase/5,10-methenyltetrahydrofolate cyclohydrolase [Deltaproteobacteria bacterium]